MRRSQYTIICISEDCYLFTAIASKNQCPRHGCQEGEYVESWGGHVNAEQINRFIPEVLTQSLYHCILSCFQFVFFCTCFFFLFRTICNLDYLRYYRDPWIWEAICEYISSSLKLRKEDVPAGNAWMKVFIDEENKRLTVNNINNSLRAWGKFSIVMSVGAIMALFWCNSRW